MKKQVEDTAEIYSPINPHYRPQLKLTADLGSFKNGKKKSSSIKYRDRDRSTYSRTYIRQLEASLTSTARDLEGFWSQEIISDELALEITEFFKAVCNTLDKTLGHKTKGAPATLRNARSLSPSVKSFETKITHLIPKDVLRSRGLEQCLKELLEDVRHYVRQIEMTYGIVRLQGANPVLSNRPSNTMAFEKMLDLIESHAHINGANSKLKPKLLRAQLSEAGYAVSERTLRIWRAKAKSPN